MNFHKIIKALILLVVCVSINGCQSMTAVAISTEPKNVEFLAPKQKEGRQIVFISDLHMNVGKINGKWHPYEDFRWPNALRGFLHHIDKAGNGATDLVILGDFLELWQNPDEKACTGVEPDSSCTIAEAKAMVERVVEGHTETFADLAAFSVKDDNRLYIVPGNHDAALATLEVWEIIATALKVDTGHVAWMRDGVWVSNDGRIVAEHGHQIEGDVNRYSDWPKVTITDSNGNQRMIQTWGENFVKSVFNKKEENYPIIDNFNPLSQGAKYIAEEQGLFESVSDVGRFLLFNIFETSLTQKGAALGTGQAPNGTDWNTKNGRALGYKLAAYAMEDDVSLRQALLSATPDEKTLELQDALDKLVQDDEVVSDDEIKALCDRVANNTKEITCGHATAGAVVAAIGNNLLGEKRLQKVLLEVRKNQNESMKMFVYGHTHKFKKRYGITLDRKVEIGVWNTGAFQRLIDDENFLTRLKTEYRGKQPGHALSLMTPEEDLKPCYTTVIGELGRKGNDNLKLMYWIMAEDDVIGQLKNRSPSNCRW